MRPRDHKIPDRYLPTMLVSRTMSQDEEDAIIGRMVREQKQLQTRETVLHEELYRIGEGLERLGRDFKLMSSQKSEDIVLGDADRALLDAGKAEGLINEMRTVTARLDQLRNGLSKL